tara:strand:+ start:7335 stop:7535 length:201 start_codon:yes stop_codon:yes gene_type:complete
MTKEEMEFLKSFKAGEYLQLTILVDTVDYPKLKKVLEGAGIKLAILPGKVSASEKFFNDEDKGTEN